MPKKPVKKVAKFAQKVAPKLKKPKVATTPAKKAVKKPTVRPVPAQPSAPQVHPFYVAQQAQASVSTQTEAEKIWDEIRNLPIQMFGLPNQTVAQHAVPFPIEPTKLYLTIRSSATLPSLEVAVGNGFTVEQADRFVVVARKVTLPFQGK